MKSWFEVRCYPNKLTEQEMEKVEFFKNGSVLRQKGLEKVSLLFSRTTLYFDQWVK